MKIIIPLVLLTLSNLALANDRVEYNAYIAPNEMYLIFGAYKLVDSSRIYKSSIKNHILWQH